MMGSYVHILFTVLLFCIPVQSHSMSPAAARVSEHEMDAGRTTKAGRRTQDATPFMGVDNAIVGPTSAVLYNGVVVDPAIANATTIWLDKALVAYETWSDYSDAYKLSFWSGEVEKYMSFGLETFWSGNLDSEQHPDRGSLRDAKNKLGEELAEQKKCMVNPELCPINGVMCRSPKSCGLFLFVRSQKEKLLTKLETLVKNVENPIQDGFRTQLQEAHDVWNFLTGIKSLSWSEDVGNLLQYATLQHYGEGYAHFLVPKATMAPEAQFNPKDAVEYFQRQIIPVAKSKLNEEMAMIEKLKPELINDNDTSDEMNEWKNVIRSVEHQKTDLQGQLDLLLDFVITDGKGGEAEDIPSANLPSTDETQSSGRV